jgi:hypothetical protein
MEDFSITTRLTEREYSKVIFTALYRKPGIVFTSILGVIIILGGLKIIPFYSDASYLEIFIGLYFLLLPTIILLRYLKQFRSTPSLQGEIIYTFNEGGYIVQGLAFKAELQWVYIRKLQEINKFLILYHTEAAGNYIDKTKLTSEQLQFIKSKVMVG